MEHFEGILSQSNNLTIKEICELAYKKGVEYGCLQKHEGSKVQIIIAPRGWIFVGYTHRDGDYVVISRSNCIRVWGTEKGLGELINGPTPKTKLDPYGVTRIPFAAVIAEIDCKESKWCAII